MLLCVRLAVNYTNLLAILSYYRSNNRLNTGSSPVGMTKFKSLDQYIEPPKQEWLA
ncbi:hypothetical protein [Photorhabdus heterorhabditis]|uniref:hypothetical protein n=1 Tax=Photorhabdus heterorhabditis TaxID=880156 RepID=UPI001561F931|nr:hypothetical protein [Photorhabdus heterorhabditis]NRN31005.1 hypothetical protein [Photorhabdus heterorhabditis subsp. aluminescens]